MLLRPGLHLSVKKIAVAMILLSLLQTAAAQSKYGVTAGGGKTSLYKFPYSPDDFDRYSGVTSWWAGITANLPVTKNGVSVFISSVYNKKGYKYLQQNETGANNTIKDSSFTQSVNYIDLNVSLRKKLVFGEESTNGFFAGTGPTASLLLNGNEAITANYFGTIKPPVNNTQDKLVKGSGAGKYKPVFFSWSFAAGLEFGNLSVALTASIPLSDYYQDASQGVPHKLKTFGISVGYTLLTHQKNPYKEKKEKKPRAEHNVPVVTPVKDTTTDSDGDGIADIYDKCPGHKGTLKYGGCPVPDTDGDGVNDDDDKCIDIPGTAANKGCPAIKDTVVASNKDTTRYTIYFEPGKSILRSDGFNALTMVVNQLKANPKLVVLFKGHTDLVGSVEANFARSLDRANVCAAYVASFYIDKNRLSVISYGNTIPAADLNDPLLQWKNRRVEVCVFEK